VVVTTIQISPHGRDEARAMTSFRVCHFRHWHHHYWRPSPSASPLLLLSFKTRLEMKQAPSAYSAKVNTGFCEQKTRKLLLGAFSDG
jgi:hypothetical protein